jgi:hypothetical protein
MKDFLEQLVRLLPNQKTMDLVIQTAALTVALMEVVMEDLVM